MRGHPHEPVGMPIAILTLHFAQEDELYSLLDGAS